MKNNAVAMILILQLCAMCAVYADANYSFNQTQPYAGNPYVQQPLQNMNSNSNQTLYGNVVMVPAGTTIPAMLTTPISSEYSRLGQSVTMALNSDFYYNNKLIAPAGSIVCGTVTDIGSAKHASMNGRLSVRFTQINTPYGTQIPISAVIKTDDNSGVLIGGTKMDVTKEYAKDIGVGTATGALSGLVFSAVSGGKVGRGAALGTAIGAGGGLVKSVWDKGNEVEIPMNSCIDIVLTQPASVAASNYSYEN